MSILGHKKSVNADTPQKTEHRSGYLFVLIFILLAIGIAAISYFSYRHYQKNTALNLRFSLEKKEIPVVKTVLGQEGIVEGIDYRGAPVVACVRAVPDSLWFLVAHIDTSEIYASIRERLGRIIGFSIILFLGAAVGMSLLWRQQNTRFYREQYQTMEQLRESKERFRSIFDNSNDGIIVADADTRKFLFGNQAIHRMLGYTSKEIMTLGVKDIHPQNDLPIVVEIFNKLVRKEINVAHGLPVQRKDDSVFYADISTHNFKLGGQNLSKRVVPYFCRCRQT